MHYCKLNGVGVLPLGSQQHMVTSALLQPHAMPSPFNRLCTTR